MGLFTFRRDQLSDDELRDALFNAIAASESRTVGNLTDRHIERIHRLFPTWKTLPPSVRSDPSRTKWWAAGLIGVASVVAALGDESLLAQLYGRPEDNILVSWQEGFLAAQADANAGNCLSAIKILEQALANANGMTGSGVDHLLPKTYGLLGISYYRTGNKDQARVFTLKAKAYCEQIGDPEGVEIYTRNLDAIDKGYMLLFRDAEGHTLTPEALQAAAGQFQFECYGGESVHVEAKTLHHQGRDAGARGDYDQALALLTKAADLAPDWPYPVYDRAYTRLLMRDFDAALVDYRKTSELAPRGFFTALTAVDALMREKRGEFPQGLYLAYMMLEPIRDTAQRRSLVQQLVEKHPRFAPGWQQFANLAETTSDRLKAIECGLAANPDRETIGMLVLNKALTLHGSGDDEGAVQLLRGLITDSESTLATEALAKGMLGLITNR